MKKSWQRIVDGLSAGGTLWSPRKSKIAYLCDLPDQPVQTVFLSTISEMTEEGLIEEFDVIGGGTDLHWKLTRQGESF